MDVEIEYCLSYCEGNDKQFVKCENGEFGISFANYF